jgi:subtilisin family serine protease
LENESRVTTGVYAQKIIVKAERTEVNNIPIPAQPTRSVERVRAPMLWEKGITGEGVLIAVVDSGMNGDHPDLTNRLWPGTFEHPHHGYNFVTDDFDLRDSSGHGTAAASQIAGDGTKGIITGVAPHSAIMMLRVGYLEEQCWRAFRFALEHKVHVISMSLTFKYPGEPDYARWRHECEALLQAGVLHANSVGDEGDLRDAYPVPYNIGPPGNCPPPWLSAAQTQKGGLSSAISCGSVDPSDRLDANSGRGPAAWEVRPFDDYPYQRGSAKGLIKPDICAPGSMTMACNWRFPEYSDAPYIPFSGTSAAAAHLGGCLALLAHACLRSGKPIIPARAQEAIESTAVKLKGQRRRKENRFGAGLIDVYAAYQYGEQRHWWE